MNEGRKEGRKEERDEEGRKKNLLSDHFFCLFLQALSLSGGKIWHEDSLNAFFVFLITNL